MALPLGKNKSDKVEYRPENRKKSFYIGFLIGIAAGTGFALLYAPAAGKEIRRNVCEKVSDGVTLANRAVNSGAAVYAGTVNTAMFQVERLFESVKAGIDEARKVKQNIESAGGLE